MNEHHGLQTALIFLAAAVIAVPVFKKLGLASVLGYLSAGSIIGPWALGLVKNVEEIMALAELGVVFLLFIIGLELKPSRLWVLRRSIFGTGGAQVGMTSIALFILCSLNGFSWGVSVVVAVSLAFSSTAFALQILAERKQLGAPHGRAAFSILLFQDLAAIPLIAAIPFLDSSSSATHSVDWFAIGKVVVVFVVLIVASRTLLRRVFKVMASTKTTEIFTAGALLLVLGVALLMESLGLSMALGAFLAGVLLADSEYRHELEADIEPFKGLLLGLFFMAIGMEVDYGLLFHRPVFIIGLALGLLVVKTLINYFVGRRSGLSPIEARKLAFVIPQGGEFAFVVFTAAVARGVMTTEEASTLVVVVTLTMALTPAVVAFNERVLSKYLRPDTKKPYDEIKADGNEIIVAGFGRFGQVVARLLRMLKIDFTALEIDPDQVETLRRFGQRVYYGDASKLDLLRAAGADKAKILVVAIDDMKASIKTVEIARQNFPHLKIYARARNRDHVFRLFDNGVTNVWRETYGSALEMAEQLLQEFGFPAARVKRTIRHFRAYDQDLIVEQHKVYQDEAQLIDVSKRAQAQLINTLEADREEGLEIQRDISPL